MDKQVKISDKILSRVPNTRLGLILANIKYEDSSVALLKEIDKEVQRISQMQLADIKNIPAISTTRAAYRALGKEPARYRPSAEALYRRIIQGKGLYRISNAVDTINLASLRTGYSIGGYDYDKIQGDVLFDIGRADDVYEAIGRGIINIENLPVFRDVIGAFGSPTTDSVRTMITDNTKRILLIIINFGVDKGFDKDVNDIADLLRKFTYAVDIEIHLI